MLKHEAGGLQPQNPTSFMLHRWHLDVSQLVNFAKRHIERDMEKHVDGEKKKERGSVGEREERVRERVCVAKEGEKEDRESVGGDAADNSAPLRSCVHTR